MHGKVCIVTGASQGIGYETALALAGDGATLTLIGRSEARLCAAVERIRAKTGNAEISHLVADLSDSRDIRRMAAEVRKRHDRLDVLVNNAGGMTRKRKLAADGTEYCWKLNHLGYVLVTLELLPLLRASAPARIVNVASHAHYRGRIAFDDLNSDAHYEMWTAYQQSKLGNVLFTFALARRLEGTGVTVNCLHPGVVGTGFVDNIGPLEKLLAPLIKLVLISPRAGAETAIHLARSPQVAGVSGQYFSNRKPVEPSALAHDREVQERLWALSLEQTGAADIRAHTGAANPTLDSGSGHT